MTQWIPCGTEFLSADVIRWQEAIWERSSRKRKARKIGTRQVTAEVLREDADGWVWLLVRDCTLLDDKTHGRRAHVLALGEEVKRKRSTVERGNPARLRWSDESVRKQLLADRRGIPTALVRGEADL